MWAGGAAVSVGRGRSGESKGGLEEMNKVKKMHRSCLHLTRVRARTRMFSCAMKACLCSLRDVLATFPSSTPRTHRLA